MKLDEKTKGLVAVAAAVSGNCLVCFKWHYTNCIKLGITVEELSEAIELAEIIKGMPSKNLNQIKEKLIDKNTKKEE